MSACISGSQDRSSTMSITDLFPEYATTSSIDTLRETEYSYLDAQDQVYLDYTGSSIASQSQHLHHASRLTSQLYGNPHSINPSSQASTHEVNSTRSRILSHLNASPDEYVVIFTQNATGAAKLVGESYPFTSNQRLVLTADNHNSINGIRVMAAAKGTKTTYIPLETPSLRLDTKKVLSALSSSSPSSKTQSLFKRVISGCIPHRSLPPLISSSSSSTTSSQKGLEPSLTIHSEKPHSSTSIIPSPSKKKKGLFGYPAQSNFTGIQHSLSLIPLAQSLGYDVLLDAAAYLPTSTLDLSLPTCKPEFLIISFYKLFGYPTGVGCLVAKKSALSKLDSRPWFSGGTVKAVSTGVQWHSMLDSQTPEKYEDGTVNFLSVPDVKFGLDWISKQVKMELINKRVKCLTGWFLVRSKALRHKNGREMIKVYGDTEDLNGRGGTVAFNILDAEGKVVDERLVGKESAAAKISLRTGCFCNPGAGEFALEIGKGVLMRLPALGVKALLTGRKFIFDDYIQMLGLPSAGAIRVSFGIASNAADVDRLVGFLENTYKDRVTGGEDLEKRESC
ncbi:molybdenum cofactor sulfurase [Podospora fimiseda]|uniref:Molybdenum cofactor sulfurase n=1 Tax=Podospora fimiseda TaxID=252190 RepID=A0AAN7BVP7_9PEZI|nr:molybdenum cofactor sulfurase [Podospora fimiseda]